MVGEGLMARMKDVLLKETASEGVKANRTERRGHRCAAYSPDYRQAAAQTALSALHAYHTAASSAGPPLTGLLHPPGSAAQVSKKQPK